MTPKKDDPQVDSFGKRELDRAAEKFEKFEGEVKQMTMDRMNEAPKEETEGSKISQKQASSAKIVYLKPNRTILAVDKTTGKAQVFNEKFRKDYEFQSERVDFVAENKEVDDAQMTIWTHPFGGVPAEEWLVPTGVPVNGPRYLAEQIKRKYYHRLVMKEHQGVTGADGIGTYTGTITADTTIQRLDAHPINQRKSVFMGASGF